MEEIELLPCPFCGKISEILVCDNEGNIHDEPGYEDDAWSGLSFAIRHEIEGGDPNNECPIATYKGEILGTQLYESREELAERWNKRCNS